VSPPVLEVSLPLARRVVLFASLRGAHALVGQARPIPSEHRTLASVMHSKGYTADPVKHP